MDSDEDFVACTPPTVTQDRRRGQDKKPNQLQATRVQTDVTKWREPTKTTVIDSSEEDDSEAGSPVVATAANKRKVRVIDSDEESEGEEEEPLEQRAASAVNAAHEVEDSSDEQYYDEEEEEEEEDESEEEEEEEVIDESDDSADFVTPDDSPQSRAVPKIAHAASPAIVVLEDSDEEERKSFAFTPKNSQPPPAARYSPEQVRELESSLEKKAKQLESNRKMFRSTSGKLPDGGAKLKKFIGDLERERDEISKELEVARENVDPNAARGASDSPPGVDEGEVVVTDDQKLELLFKKQRILRTQFSILRPEQQPEKAEAMKKEIAKVNMEIMRLKESIRSGVESNTLQEKKTILIDSATKGN